MNGEAATQIIEMGRERGRRIPSQLPIFSFSGKKDFSGESVVVLSCVSSRRKIVEWIHKDSAFTSNGSHFRGHETEYTRGKLATGKVSPVTRSISARRFNFSRPRHQPLHPLVHGSLFQHPVLCHRCSGINPRPGHFSDRTTFCDRVVKRVTIRIRFLPRASGKIVPNLDHFQ